MVVRKRFKKYNRLQKPELPRRVEVSRHVGEHMADHHESSSLCKSTTSRPGLYNHGPTLL